jgi:hypothetical protein
VSPISESAETVPTASVQPTAATIAPATASNNDATDTDEGRISTSGAL